VACCTARVVAAAAAAVDGWSSPESLVVLGGRDEPGVSSLADTNCLHAGSVLWARGSGLRRQDSHRMRNHRPRKAAEAAAGVDRNRSETSSSELARLLSVGGRMLK